MKPDLSIGGVFADAWRLVSERWGVLLIVGVLFSAMPAMLEYAVYFGHAPDVPSIIARWVASGFQQAPNGDNAFGNVDDIINSLPPNYFIYTIIQAVITSLLTGLQTVLLYAGVVLAAERQVTGQWLPTRQILRRSFLFIVPLLVLWVITSVAIGIGTLLLIVPGLFIWTIWAICFQVRVAEGSSIANALSRSAALTEGQRWRTFAVLLISTVGAMFFLLAVTGFTEPFIYDGGMWQSGAGSHFTVSHVTAFIVLPIAYMLTQLVPALCLTTLYQRLRDRQDGPATETLADVFG